MTSKIIIDKVDFQRNLNGCERLINDLSKSLQVVEKVAQKLLINPISSDQIIYFQELNNITSQIEYLYSSIAILDQSSFALNCKKRLDVMKTTLEKNRNKFERIQQYSRITFGYEYKQSHFESIPTEQQEQLMKLIEKDPLDAQFELDLIHQRSVTISTLEHDLTGLRETFIDMNNLVHQQGAAITTIEQSLTTADEMVCKTKEDIQTVVNVRKRTRCTKWIFITIVISACILLILIIYFALKLALPLRK
ncbi:hypothetical protein I4U23_019358 [Adineta vaga]|nr:hypothetical protein I4U23_019358 [Adineta vaga]